MNVAGMILGILAIVTAFGCTSKDSTSPSCVELEAVSDRTGLISQSEAEESATEWVAMSAPEVTGTDVERVWASCLTTLRSYEQDLLRGSFDSTSPSCVELEAVSDRTGLISQSEAEESATEWVAMSAPEVTGTDVERVWASCLTTLRSYEQDLLRGTASTNPDVRPLNLPIWIVEVKGASRPAGISSANANNPYRYAALSYPTQIIDARTGKSIGGYRRYEPLLEPSPWE